MCAWHCVIMLCLTMFINPCFYTQKFILLMRVCRFTFYGNTLSWNSFFFFFFFSFLFIFILQEIRNAKNEFVPTFHIILYFLLLYFFHFSYLCWCCWCTTPLYASSTTLFTFVRVLIFLFLFLFVQIFLNCLRFMYEWAKKEGKQSLKLISQ